MPDETLPTRSSPGPDDARPDNTGHSLGLAIGQMLGRYQLTDVIGAGGFGVVYRAHQREPVVRDVALKVIKPGMDSAAVLARFEAERQALAVMDHPNVAKVLDAGATEHGLPYFVMDLVDGKPISAFCDDERLSIAERIMLFHQVCNAVQHAHAKGIIHRDLKPSNILVTRVDGEPTARVIDFGIAKAIRQEHASDDVFTRQGQFIGTPEYMSPEQSGLADIDTRTDVYALGVILYELLTGSLPFEPESLRRAALDEVKRIIREVDPPRPSTRLVSSGANAESAAAVRRTDTRQLTSTLRGELDWVVMRCLEKDRARRYDTPSQLAADLQRYITNEPVEARPPSTPYRVRKFIRRHSAGVAVALLLAATVAFGLVGTTLGFRDALTQRDRARDAEQDAQAQAAEARRQRDVAQAINQFMNADFIGRIDPDAGGRTNLTVLELLDRATPSIDQTFSENPEVEAPLRLTVGTAYGRLGDTDRAQPHLKRADELFREIGAEDSLDRAEALRALGNLPYWSFAHASPAEMQLAEQRLKAALDILQRSGHGDSTQAAIVLGDIATLRQLAAQEFIETIESSLVMVAMVRGKGETPEQVRTLIEDLLVRVAMLVDEGREAEARQAVMEMLQPFLDNPLLSKRVPVALNSISGNLRSVRRWTEAGLLSHIALDLANEILGPEHRESLIVLQGLARHHSLTGDHELGLELMTRAYEIALEAHGPSDASTTTALNGIGVTLSLMGEEQRALEAHQQAFEVQVETLGPTHKETVVTLSNVVSSHIELGNLEEAIRLARQAERAAAQGSGADSWLVGHCLRLRGRALGRLDRFEEAERILQRSLEICLATRGPAHRQTIESYIDLARLHERWHTQDPDAGHDEKARSWRAKMQ
jgi:serine/threonine protein kinase